VQSLCLVTKPLAKPTEMPLYFVSWTFAYWKDPSFEITLDQVTFYYANYNM